MLLRKGNDFPSGRIKAYDAFWAVTLEHHVEFQFHFDACSPVHCRYFFHLEYSRAFAVVHWVVGHQCFAGNGESTDGLSGWWAAVARRREVWILDGNVLEERRIDSSKKGDVDELLRIVDGGDPAGQAAFTDVNAMGRKLAFGCSRSAFVIEPDVGDSSGTVERGPGDVEENGLSGLECRWVGEALALVDSGSGLDVECFGNGRVRFLDSGLRHREFHGFGVEPFDFPELFLT